MEPSRDISRLLEIMARLRDPETGCPWDVEQTFETIVPYTIEEAYEVADAIERGDMVDLPDELGDLLLQVVFHARMAEEAGHFDFGDVVEAITKKMIRRHPHVFGDESVRGRKLAKGMWEKIKAEEKAEKAARYAAARKAAGQSEGEPPSLLDDVPRALPALIRAIKLQRKAARVGFDWDTAPPILDKIEEEIGELREVMESGEQDKVREEYGDLLFALVNLGRHLDVEPEAALEAANLKFFTRFRYIEKALAAGGRDPAAATLDEMEALWQQAKTAARPDGGDSG
ncbi:nucleoside triphosphate pyrophosphohydrolase [Oricola thermophila]|uniref:Nucleoside triphosphate pyrophosphohydrolase n=1 Tax=Oricola thermophila TaxID=2742145 RepID=A0A6N1VB69_9HYPH|nr:nucleoside triphosphate pyrophosphohydrolase [Oricola thermophila]QKV18164.1 nucleoside triphosphate pyrophosphohydrolase [Oricola thermophila]